MALAKKYIVAKKAVGSGVGVQKMEARGSSKGPSQPTKLGPSPSSPDKIYTVVIRSGVNESIVTWSPTKGLQARTTSKPAEREPKSITVDLSRSKVVGKHPEVKHLPAPKSKLKLDKETQKSLLASMVLN